MAAPRNERRRNPRRKPPQLVYLEFGRENGGMVKDVSEGGMRFHLMGPVAAGQSLSFGVTIDAARRIEGQALMVWTDASGKSGGMSFTELSAPAEETLRAWLAEIDGPQQTADDAPAVARPENLPAPSPAPNPIANSVASPVSNGTAESARQTVPSPVPASPGTAEEAAPTPLPVQVVAPPAESAPPQAPAMVAAIAALETALRDSAESAATNDAPVAISPPPLPSPEKRTWEIPMALPGRSSGSRPVIAEPVSRAEWQEAAREEITPGRRRVPGMIGRPPAGARETARNAGTSLEAAKFAAIAEQVDPAGVFLKAAAADENAKHASASHGGVYGPDAMRDFLRQPLAAAPQEGDLSQYAAGGLYDEAPETAARKSPMGVILVVATLAAAVAFATIAFRQPVGEFLIRLGEMLSGESRGAVSGAPVGPVQTSPARDAQGSPATPLRQADLPNENLRPAQTTKPVNPTVVPPASGNTNAPGKATNGGSNAPAGGPISQEPPQPPRTVPETELASGREIVPGKARPLAKDLDSLWLDVENGNTAAEIELANRYATGNGVQKNCEQARVLLVAAAKHGSETAAKRLAELPAAGCQ